MELFQSVDSGLQVATFLANCEVTFLRHSKGMVTYHCLNPCIYKYRAKETFCPDCGTPIYSAAIKEPPTYSLRVGGIKQRFELRPKRQIWCSSALPWSMDLRDVEKLSRQ